MKKKPKIVSHSDMFETNQANVVSTDINIKSAQYVLIPEHIEKIKIQYNDLTIPVYDSDAEMKVYLEEKEDSYTIAIISRDDLIIQNFEFSDQNKEIQIDLYYKPKSGLEMLMVISKNE